MSNGLKGYYRQEENIILFRNPPRVDYGVLHDSISATDWKWYAQR